MSNIIIPANIPSEVACLDLIRQLIDLGLVYEGSGKVRITFSIPWLPEYLLIVATDRISAKDRVLLSFIPDKGAILTAMTIMQLEDVLTGIEHHLVSYGENMLDFIPDLVGYEDILSRSMIVKKAKPISTEAIARGYLVGSGWKDYQGTGSVCGIKLPKGLRNADKLSEAIFTPSTKAAMGEHDENIDFGTLCGIVGADTASEVKRLSLLIYRQMASYAESRNIIVADVKLEFGYDERGVIILIDEIGTPDSSRFWGKDAWMSAIAAEDRPDPKSFDKEPIRRYVEAHGFGPLSAQAKIETSHLYHRALYQLSGLNLDKFKTQRMGL